MNKNSATSPFINTADVMEALCKTEQMAQLILRDIRKSVGKTLQQPITVENYASYFKVSEKEAKIAFKKEY